MGKRLFIRADMNQVIATGHVMRCLSIADAAEKQGITPVFLTADREPVELIQKRGYETIVLGSDWQDKEGELWAMEALIRDLEIADLLVDSYQVTPAYLHRLQELTRVTYLDDLNLFPYPVFRVVNYANYADELSYPACVEWRTEDGHGGETIRPDYCLGTRYVPLRGMFQDCPPKRISDRIDHILLMSGGSDPLDLLQKNLSGLELSSYRSVTVICGRFYEKKEILRGKFSAYPNVRILDPVENMRDYLEEADVVICAGGTTLYEVCAVGTPAISFSMADNQLMNVRRFDRDGLIAYAGDGRRDDVPGGVRTLLERYASAGERRERSIRMQALVDGNGSTHIVEALF